MLRKNEMGWCWDSAFTTVARMCAPLLLLFCLMPFAAHAVTEDQKLTASDATAGDRFGRSLSVSGDTALVGANFDDGGGSNSGSAYVFVNSGGVWTQQQKLTASDAAADDQFGDSVSVSGDTALVGANFDDDGGSDSGSAYVFVRSGGVWTQQQKLTASDAAKDDAFGFSVSVSGDTALVGAYREDGGGSQSGSAYVFVRSGGVWTQQQKLTASDAAAGDWFGWSVSVSGDTALIAAYQDDDVGTDSGSAYVFVRSGSVWTEQQKLTASDAAAYDAYGHSVSLSGDTALVGAFADDDGGTNSGSAYVFVRSGGAWTQQQKLTANDAAAGDWFGIGVSVSGDTALIGSRADDGAINSGSAYVFVRSGGVWTQEHKLTASDAAATDIFGDSVSMSGDTALVGAFLDDDAGSESGSAYVFNLDETPPNVTSITPLTSSPTNAATVSFTVTFDEEVQGFEDAADVVISHTGTANAGVSISGGPSSYTVDVTGVSGDGSFTLAVDTSSNNIVNLAGHDLASSVTSMAVVIDNTAPTFEALSVTPSSAAVGETVMITFETDETLAGEPDVTLNGNAATRTAKGVTVYEYAYVVQESDAPGAAETVVSGVDLAGNVGALNDTSALTIVEPTSQLPVAVWPGVLALAGLGALVLRRRGRR